MQKKLLLMAFDKAEIEVGSERIYTRAKHLSEQIYSIDKNTYGEKILTVKYNAAIDTANEKIHLKPHAAEALSKYLGYDNYADFTKQQIEISEKSNKNLTSIIKKNKLTLIVILIIISSIFIYSYSTRQRWMIWQEDHYIEVDFDVQKYSVNQIKVFKEERILYFKKVKPKCDDVFFDKGGNVLMWYGKNRDKNYEFFTALGLHPETGKTLKPITSYIIDKYICKE